MRKLSFDSGIQEFKINGGGVLRFNPSDLNVYSRFQEAVELLRKAEEDLVAKGRSIQEGEDSGAQILVLMKEADGEVKKILRYIFGEENDFDQITGGVNLMSVAGNGERVITNFLAMLQPILEEGARNSAKEQSNAAVREAKLNREQRRAQQRAKK